MSADLEVGRYEVGGLRVTFEGRTAWLAVSSSDPADLREQAEKLEAEAAERLWRARRARALADHWEAARAVAGEERRARNAAARERRAAEKPAWMR